MKKSAIRKALTIAMALFLLVGMIPASALASEGAQEDSAVETVSASSVVEEETATPAAEPAAVDPTEEAAPAAEEAQEEATSESTSVEDAAETSESTSSESATSEETAEEQKGDAAEEVAEEQKAEDAEKDKADEKKDEKKDDAAKQPEVKYPAFSAQQTVDGVKVTVTAPEGAFPEGATLSVKKLVKAEQQKVDKVLDQVRENDENVVASYTFDIQILGKDGKEVQPANKKKVNVSFKLAAVKNDNLDTQIYHIEDEKQITKKDVEELDVKTTGDVATVVTDGFSYYTVEFTYEDMQYVLPGDTSIALADILKTVGLSGNVTNVTVSNDTLFSASNASGQWIITANKAFTSTEWMKVTIEGVEYEIVVTDAIPGDVVSAGDVDMTNNDSAKTGNFTIKEKGRVTAARNNTATIKDGIITVQDGTSAQALLARIDATLNIQSETINMEAARVLGSTYRNGKMNFTDCTIDGGSNDWSDGVLLSGGSGTDAGTFTFAGTSKIQNVKGNAKITGPTKTVTSGTLTIKDSEISIDGGPIVVKDKATLVIDGSTITCNTDGPAIVLEEGATLQVINGSTIKDATKGAISAKGATIEIEESTFENNVNAPYGNGGVIYATNNSTVTIDDESTFTGNSAYLGGALYLENCTTTIGASTFDKNGSDPAILDDEYVDNMTSDGGAICTSGGTLILNGTTFTNNIAAGWDDYDFGSGGAVYAGAGTKLDVNGATFENNTAGVYGGAICLAEDRYQNSGGGAVANIGASDDGTPTTFDGNEVVWATHFAGGGICVHGSGVTSKDARLYMKDVAIYNNYADGAGGGIATCQQGTSKLMVVEGAAIYNNKVGDSTPVGDATTYSDIYIFENGTDRVDGNELYERMFNGGLHNWNTKTADEVEEWWADPGTGFLAKSNPTKTSTDGATVIFTNNSAKTLDFYIEEEGIIASGGAISNNGLLKIGAMTEIKVVKLWDDNKNASGKRPSEDELKDSICIFADDSEEPISTDGLLIDVITENVENYELFNNVVSSDDSTPDFGDKDAWLIVISGLPKYSDGAATTLIEYHVAEDVERGAEYWVVNEETGQYVPGGWGLATGDMATHFEITNRYAEGKLVIEGTKTLLGRSLENEEFEFTLWRRDYKTTTGHEDVEVAKAKNDKDGNFSFEISYSLNDYNVPRAWKPDSNWPDNEGTEGAIKENLYHYYITETVGEDATIDYDKHTEYITVKVAYDGTTELKVTKAYDDDGVKFTNIYPEGKAKFEATKTITGKKLAADEFEFVLTNEAGEEVAKAKNDASGKIVFDEITYTLADILDADAESEVDAESLRESMKGQGTAEQEPITKTFTYTLKEVKGKDDHIIYDDNEYKATVTVTYTPGNPELKVSDVVWDKTPEFKNKAYTDVSISKQDLNGTELDGAVIQVKNKDTGDLIEEWTSSATEVHTVKLLPGTYILVEKTAPTGYQQITTEIEFKVNDDGTVTLEDTKVEPAGAVEYKDGVIILKDEVADVTVKISKTDLDGTEVEGAKIVIKDSEGNVVDSWESKKEAHEITVVPGEYTMIEESAPDGYLKVNTEISFTVNEDGTVTVNTQKVEPAGAVEFKDGVLYLRDMAKPVLTKTVSVEDGDATTNATAVDRTKPLTFTLKTTMPGQGFTTYEVYDKLEDVLKYVDGSAVITIGGEKVTDVSAEEDETGQTISFDLSAYLEECEAGTEVEIVFQTKIKDGADLSKYTTTGIPNTAYYMLDGGVMGDYEGPSNKVTVKIKEPTPTATVKPTTAPKAATKSATSAKTADTSHAATYLALLLASMGCALLLVSRRRRNG